MTVTDEIVSRSDLFNYTLRGEERDISMPLWFIDHDRWQSAGDWIFGAVALVSLGYTLQAFAAPEVSGSMLDFSSDGVLTASDLFAYAKLNMSAPVYLLLSPLDAKTLHFLEIPNATPRSGMTAFFGAMLWGLFGLLCHGLGRYIRYEQQEERRLRALERPHLARTATRWADPSGKVTTVDR